MKTEMQDKESLGRDGEGGFWRSKYQKRSLCSEGE